MATWHEITRDPEYQELSEQGKALVKQGFFEREISSDPEFKTFSPQTQKAIFDDFWQTPDDTGQGIVTSTLGSAIRGAGEIVPGTLQGVGALTGITPISDLGESARAGLEYIAPVNPIYEQGNLAKVAQVGGNVASIIGTSGVGGLAGKALGAGRAAAAGSAAARQALTNQAIQAGAKSALYGTGFAQGAAAKAEENKRLGITGAEGYLNLLGGGVSELAPEMLPFGTALESAAARRLLGGVDDAAGRVIPGIRMSAAQEAAEGGSTQVLSNLSTQLTAPTGVEAPGLFEGAGEAALWESVGGAMFGAINKLGRTPPEKQTDEQRAYAAELGAVPVNSSPPITPEESLENFNQGGIPVVSPDGVVTTLPFNREDIRSTELPFSRQNIRGLSQLGQPAISPGLTAAVNTADSIVTTAENTSSDVSQATTAARNIIQGVVDTPQPREAPAELPAVTPSPAMEQTEKTSQTITDSNGEIAPEMSVLPPTVQAGAGAGEAPPRAVNAPLDPADKQIDAPIAAKNGYVVFERPDGKRYKLRDNSKTPPEWQNAEGKKVMLKGFGTGIGNSFLLQPQSKNSDYNEKAPVGDTVYHLYEEDSGRSLGNLSATQLFQTGWTFVEEVKPAEAPPITPQGTPTPATEGKVMPGGSAIERDTTKPYANISIPDLEALPESDWSRRRDYLEGKMRNNQQEKSQLLKTPKSNWENREYNENARINDVAASLRAAIQDMQSSRPDLEAEFRAKSSTQAESGEAPGGISQTKGKVGSSATNTRRTGAELQQQPKTLPSVSEQPEVAETSGESGGNIALAGSGTGNVVASNAQKFAANILAQFKADELAENAEKLKEKYYSINASTGKRESESKDRTLQQWKQAEAKAKKAKADAFAELRKQNKGFTVAQLEDREPFMAAKTLEQHGLTKLATDIGYTRQGDLYVFQPTNEAPPIQDTPSGSVQAAEPAASTTKDSGKATAETTTVAETETAAFDERLAMSNDLAQAEFDYQKAKEASEKASDLFFSERNKVDTRKNPPWNYSYRGPKINQERLMMLASKASESQSFFMKMSRDLGIIRDNYQKLYQPEAGTNKGALDFVKSDNQPYSSGKLEVIHYSRKPLVLRRDYTPDYESDGDAAELYGSDGEFGEGLYSAEQSDESMWKNEMDGTIILGKYRNELTINPQNPLVITPNNLLEYLTEFFNSNDNKTNNRGRFLLFLKEQAIKNDNDSIIISGFASEKVRNALFRKWRDSFNETDAYNAAKNPEERGLIGDKASQDLFGVPSSVFDIASKMQNQVFVAPQNIDIVTTSEPTTSKTETAAPSAKEAAVASVVQQPVEGSIPTVAEESATTAIESTEKADVAEVDGDAQRPVLDPVGYGNALIALFPSLKKAGVQAITVEEAMERLDAEWQKKKASGKATRLDQLVYMANKKNTQSALEGGDIGGLWTRSDKTVAVSNKATPSSMAHEIGHAIMELEYVNAPEATKKAIEAEYTKWFKSKYGSDGVPSVADQRRIWEWMTDADWMNPDAPFPQERRVAQWEAYRSKFSEWFADETAKWAATRDAPKSLVDKFFSELAQKLKKLWDSVRGSFSPNETLASWLDSISVASPAKDQLTIVETDVAKEAMRFLEADLTDTQRAKWTPEMFTAAQAFFDSGGKDFDSLKKAIKFPRVVQQAYLKADNEAAAEQTRREAADAAMAREVEKAAKEQAKLEADQKQREELGLKTLNSLIEKTRTNVVQGTVKSSDANQAVAILNKSGAIPNVLFTWIGTSKDFLADPANRARYPETWRAVSNNNNAEGWSENGQPIVFTDNVGVSDLDRNLAKLQGTTPEIAAVRRVILHENIHKGMFFLNRKDKMKLFEFLHRLYSPEELDQLAKSYDEYSDWRINQDSYFSIIEEAMTRDFDSMAEIPRDGIWAEFMQFLRDIWQKITGKTSEPTLKNYKDVFRLIRNSLKNSEAANADRLKNGGSTMMSMSEFISNVTPEQDAAYAKAVEAGDMEAAQRMVDETAKAAGFNVGPIYRTNKTRRTVFDPQAGKTGPVVRFTGDKSYALLYGEILTEAYLRINNPFILDENATFTERGKNYDLSQADVDAYKAKGYDGILISPKKGFSKLDFNGLEEAIVFTSSQIKSADPVTYDDAGNVIPLSRRFQSASNDIRFSKVIYDSPNEAAFNSGAEVARNADYDERDKAVRSTIRAAYDLAPKDNGPSVPLDQLFDIAKQSMPDLTENEFSQILQDLYEDSGALLQAGESPFIVTTPDGQRAGSAIIVSSLPTGAMASTIDPESDATKKFVKDIQGIESGTLKAAFGGRQFFDFEPVEYTVRSNKSYEQTAINYVNNFIAEGGTLEQMANSVIAPNFLAGIGIEDDVMARQALVAEVKNRVVNAGSKKKSKVDKKFFERLNQRISAFWQGVGSKGGRNQGQRAYIIGNPRYSWMFLTDEVDKELKQRRDNILNVQFGNDNATSFTQNSYENADMASTVSADEVAKDTINDTEWDLIKEGEQVFDGARKTIWERVKFLVARIALYARVEAAEIKSASKASFTDAQRDELASILTMPKAEREKAKAKDLAELDSLMAKLLGEESPTDTPTEKKKRNKRKEIIDTVEKRVKAGEPIEAPEEVETSEDEVTKAEATAQAILKDLSERYSDPLIFRDKKPNINEMRELYKERVKQGNSTSQMTEKTFVNKAIELGADEKTAGILWSAAELEIDAREAMRQDKIRQRNAAAGERADAQAHRIIFAKERLKRQSGFADIDTNPNKDTIIKAFREQVKTPIALDAFIQRLIPLKVSRQVAERLFRAAERENTDLAAMAVYDRTQGPKALKRMVSEINLMRRGEEIPLRTPIPWRKLLSQKAKTVEEYRQRIFDAISANEELKSATPEQKARLADLFTEAWESNRKRILDGMQERLIREKEAKGDLSKKGAEALQEQRMRMVEDINLGIFDNDEIAKIMAEKFGIKSEFTDAEREKIESLIEILQDEKLNRVKRNKAAYELLETLSAQTDIPIAKLLANFWVSSVLSGMNTVFSIGMSVFSGMGELTTTLYRIFVSAFSNPKQLPSEVAAAFKTLARVLSAVPRQANRAWQYLVTGDQAFLDPTMNDALKNMDWDSIGKNTQLAEQMAKSDKTLQKVMGLFMRTVSRLLTALDLFNSGLTKEGSLSIVFRQLNLDPAKIEMLEKKSDLKAYKAQVIRDYFNNVQPKTLNEKALVESYAMAEMMKALDELGSVSENADQMAMQGAMTLDPSGIGGYGYRLVKSMMKSAESGTDKLVERNLRKWDEAKNTGETTEAGVKLALSYIFQFAAYNAANLVGVRFARFAGNKFNQSLSFLPGLGALRLFEAEFDADRIRGKEAFTDMIKRNQITGVMAAVIGYYVLKAVAEEPDDEKRGWFINGGWSNLTPEKKQQKLASGQKEYTLGFGDTVINYGNWPGSGIIAAIGGLSDLIRFSPEQWSEKTVSDKLMSATASGVFSALEVPALSQFQELFGSSLSSKDPNEQKLTKFARVIGNYAGGFVPRILKDIDYSQDPSLRKYETLWEKIASHIPVYRRYEGKEYYDILGQQIQRNIYPGSREFMTKPTDPAYKVLGALNSRGIWLTPANAEHRMVGKGARRRSLTQEEADNYSLETGKGYKQMLLRYGQRALQMPTERAKAFLLDKADDVRDRALKKVYRGYTPAS